MREGRNGGQEMLEDVWTSLHPPLGGQSTGPHLGILAAFAAA